ncbi:DUF58 domain-containing protein [Legionella londiniensis]|uniref:DUF58 domain-containing protein n=1 Tax=Legionella londiniensis TaxID=45068 RepID=A0A0W0VI56_9GAMM|nr:DUF58 domain-containing protein [Legionella londiniensis]KTD19804.1 hypothetical protein Llon_1976 [Legionella londiniensis]STX92285.1 Uncharacterized conserved protein (some members contain a von Willebrand factor type A (vWA) domain) [Legionella londiniensis]
MSDGIEAGLDELIALRRYARNATYRPESRVLRAGNHLSKLRGRGMDFSEVRNYQPGDEVRHMEWRVTARTGRPHVKLYQEERERPAIIVVDFSPSMFFGTRLAFKSVIAARLAAIIAWTVVADDDRVGGLIFSESEHHEFNPRARNAGVLPLLAALSDYTKARKTGHSEKNHLLAQALLRLRRVARPGNILILISDFYGFDEDCVQHLNRLRMHNDILAYHICDPLELEPPKPQKYPVTDGVRELLLDTTDPAVAKAYRQYFAARTAKLQEQLKQLQIQYVQVTPDMDLPLLIRRTYPRRTAHG